MFDTQAALGGGGEAGGKGQAQAQAMLSRLGGEKRFEQVFAGFIIDAMAIVAHPQAILVALPLAFEPQLG
ncbi:hypothetical protein D3C72_2413180 [compost metagenome]